MGENGTAATKGHIVHLFLTGREREGGGESGPPSAHMPSVRGHTHILYAARCWLSSSLGCPVRRENHKARSRLICFKSVVSTPVSPDRNGGCVVFRHCLGRSGIRDSHVEITSFSVQKIAGVCTRVCPIWVEGSRIFSPSLCQR